LSIKPRFFRSPTQFREWLRRHHAEALELLVGFYKKDSGQPSITWPEAVDAALCYGWIDGVRRRIDDSSYTIRFTPRKPASVWSSVNIARAEALIAQGEMRAAGVAAFPVRKASKSSVYSYEQKNAQLAEPYRQLLRKTGAARDYFESQPPSYRRAAAWWVMSAKQEATRLKRLERLIACSPAAAAAATVHSESALSVRRV
jgi:uncharacterized protein YdeI (YjbR/CyaY-like superfamily)